MLLPRLYLITDRKQCSDIFFVVEEALKAGLRILQIREKDLSSSALYNLTLKMRRLTRSYDALLIVNDRVDIALATGADGVHIGKGSVPVDIVKKLCNNVSDKFLIGYSAHSKDEILKVEKQGASFVTISPIYAPLTKKNYKPRPKGTSILDELGAVSVPVYALGGVTLGNVISLKSSYGVALISDIMSSDNPRQKTANLLKVIYNNFAS